MILSQEDNKTKKYPIKIKMEKPKNKLNSTQNDAKEDINLINQYKGTKQDFYLRLLGLKIFNHRTPSEVFSTIFQCQ